MLVFLNFPQKTVSFLKFRAFLKTNKTKTTTKNRPDFSRFYGRSLRATLQFICFGLIGRYTSCCSGLLVLWFVEHVQLRIVYFLFRFKFQKLKVQFSYHKLQFKCKMLKEYFGLWNMFS